MVVAAAVVMHYIYMLSIISPLDVAFIYLYITYMTILGPCIS